MGNYKPAPFPRKSKYNTIFSEATYQVKLAYYRYEINTGQYLMSPGEKTAYNLVLVLLFAFLFAAVYFYLPRTTFLGLQRLAYYVTGTHHKIEMAVMNSMAGVVSQSRDIVATLGAEAAQSLSPMGNTTAFAP